MTKQQRKKNKWAKRFYKTDHMPSFGRLKAYCGVRIKPFCRCRDCDRNDIPLRNMAVASIKLFFGGYTGVCKDCIKKDR